MRKGKPMHWLKRALCGEARSSLIERSSIRRNLRPRQIHWTRTHDFIRQFQICSTRIIHSLNSLARLGSLRTAMGDFGHRISDAQVLKSLPPKTWFPAGGWKQSIIRLSGILVSSHERSISRNSERAARPTTVAVLVVAFRAPLFHAFHGSLGLRTEGV